MPVKRFVIHFFPQPQVVSLTQLSARCSVDLKAVNQQIDERARESLFIADMKKGPAICRALRENIVKMG